MASCIGVDGAKSGWLAVWRAGPGFGFMRYPSALALVAAHTEAGWIAVDIPIGLSDAGARPPDALARRFVGGKRASSVFSAPVRGVLDAQSQAEASARHREIDGRGFGAQAFAILPKIREWDNLLRSDARLAQRVWEIHPEVCFAAMNCGSGLAASKKTVEGQTARCDLLAQHFDESAVRDLLTRVSRAEAAADDVLDALAALWTSQRIANRSAQSLPQPPARDGAGLSMAIWY